MSTEFKHKRIFISGASSGFGYALAKRLASYGADLILVDINPGPLESLAVTLREQHKTQVVTGQCDVSNESDLQSCLEEGIKTLGGLDIAVNNAGMAMGYRPLLKITEEEFDKTMAVNAKGVFFAMKHQVPHMLANGGIILNVSSVAGIFAAPGMSDYAAAKHAVSGMTKSAAVEFGKQNIRVNAICPYFSPTGIIEGVMNEKQAALFQSINPMKRFGEIEEIVSTMISMISPSNGFLNGQCIAVDGGITAQ